MIRFLKVWETSYINWEAYVKVLWFFFPNRKEIRTVTFPQMMTPQPSYRFADGVPWACQHPCACSYGNLPKLVGIQVLFLFQFLTSWPWSTYMNLYGFFFANGTFFFFKVKAKVLLQTSCLHPSVALPHEQTLPVCLFLLLLFSHCLVTHESIIPEKEEPPRFQAHRNNFSLEQCFWMTGCDF